MFRNGFIATGLALALVASSAFGQDAKLEWKFKEGETFYLQTKTTLKQDMKTLGKSLIQNTEQTTVYSIKVLKVEANKNVVLEQKIESLAVKNLTGGANPTDDKFNQQLLGAAFKVTLGPTGDVLKLEGYDDLVKKIAGDDANAQKVVRATLGEEALKRAAADVFSFLPDKPIKTWERKVDLQLGPLGNFDSKKTFTLEGKQPSGDKQLDKITFVAEGKYAPPMKPEGSPFPFQVVKGDLKTEDYKGTLLFDAKDGRLVSSTISIKITGAVTIMVGGTNLDTTVSQEQNIESTISDKLPTPPK